MKYRIYAVLNLLLAMSVSAPLQAGWLEHTISTSFSGGTSVKAVDIDEDGDMDILGAAWNSGISWWENDDSTSTAGEGIQELISALSLNPNPSVGSFTIGYSVSQNCTVTADVYDMSGRLSMSRAENADTGINSIYVTDMIPGVYLVRLMEGNNVYSGKAIVIR